MSQKKMLEEQWIADPAQLGRITAGDAVDVQVRVAFWRVPGGDAEAMRLVKEAEALCAAAPAMAKALLAVWEHDRRCRESPEDAHRSPIETVTAALALAGVPLP